MPTLPRPRRFRLSVVAALLLTWLAPVSFAKPADWLAEIDALTAHDTTQPPPADAVVFVGSSSIRRWTTLAADFPGVPLVPRGFGGSEVADSVFYFERIVAPYHPRLVVLYAGENDLAAGKTPEAVASDFDAFRRKLHARLPEARLIYLSIKPSPLRENLLPAFRSTNALIAATCARDPQCRYLDVHTPLLTADGHLRPELYAPDRLHLTHDGYAVWIPLLVPLLRP